MFYYYVGQNFDVISCYNMSLKNSEKCVNTILPCLTGWSKSQICEICPGLRPNRDKLQHTQILNNHALHSYLAFGGFANLFISSESTL